MSFVETLLRAAKSLGTGAGEDPLMQVSVGHHILNVMPEIPLPHAIFNNFLAHVPGAL